MATPLTKPVRREVTIVTGRTPRRFVVSMTPDGVTFREKGRRFTLTLPWSSGLVRAEVLAGQALAAEKKARRKARRASRNLL